MMATCAPTEISICPAQMTIVMPMAMTPMTELCTKMLVILRQRKEVGVDRRGDHHNQDKGHHVAVIGKQSLAE